MATEMECARDEAELALGEERGASGALLARLLVQHDRQLMRYIASLLPRRDDAEEVLQRTAVTLWEKFDEFDPTRAFLPWAVRIAYFEALNYRKQAARERLVFSAEVVEALAATREEMGEELDLRRTALERCMDGLNAVELDLLRRRYADPATVAALARDVGTTSKSLYRRLDRLREALARCVRRRLAESAV